MRSVDYLKSYYPFDASVLEAVERAGNLQKDRTWPEFAQAIDLPDLQYFTSKSGKANEVLDITPRDYDQIYVYHMPMGCALNSNLLMHVSTLSTAAPDKRVISFSNPGPLGKVAGKLTLQEAWQVWNGNLRPTVEPTLEYLYREGIESAVHIGESYGADKAAASAEYATQYDQEVPHAVMTEPTSVAKRNLVKMGSAFLSTSEHVDKYLEPVRSRSKAFISAEDYQGNPIDYVFGLARLSNLAIGHALGQTGFEGRVDRAMQSQPELKTSIIWGTESELAINALLAAITDRLVEKHGAERVKRMPLEGHKHAMNLDIFLNTAIALQALR